MKKVLVIEDNPSLGRMWKRMLSRLGVDVTVAGTVASGLWFLSEEDYAVVICDFQLPDGTGAKVHEWVTTKKPHLLDAFFFCTGVPHIAQEQCGPDLQFINKPFGPGDLEAMTSRLE